MEIIELKIDEIIPYDKNPRKNDDAVGKLVESIKTFGFKVPIIIDKNNVIVCGHTRHKAAKKLKMDKVPCIYADDLSEEQIKAFRLADNKVAEFSEWDFDLLDEELSGILDIDMEDFGFELNDPEEETEVVEDDYNEALPEEPKAKRGDIYQLGRHRLMCGDSTSVEDVQMLVGGGCKWICLLQTHLTMLIILAKQKTLLKLKMIRWKMVLSDSSFVMRLRVRML